MHRSIAHLLAALTLLVITLLALVTSAGCAAHALRSSLDPDVPHAQRAAAPRPRAGRAGARPSTELGQGPARAERASTGGRLASPHDGGQPHQVFYGGGARAGTEDPFGLIGHGRVRDEILLPSESETLVARVGGVEIHDALVASIVRNLRVAMHPTVATDIRKQAYQELAIDGAAVAVVVVPVMPQAGGVLRAVASGGGWCKLGRPRSEGGCARRNSVI